MFRHGVQDIRSALLCNPKDNQIAGLAAEPRAKVVTMHEEASYICCCCGEEVITPIDASAGRLQQYVEDCPVCCRPNVLQVCIDADGRASIRSEPE